MGGAGGYGQAGGGQPPLQFPGMQNQPQVAAQVLRAWLADGEE